MPAPDASADVMTVTTCLSDLSGLGGNSEDTLDLRLPRELLTLMAGASPGPASGGEGTARGTALSRGPRPTNTDPLFTAARDDLLDRVADWGPFITPVGRFQLVPVRLDRDLPLIADWMNDPAVAAYWDLAGSRTQTEDHLRSQLSGDGRSVPCVGMLDGIPMSYWEIYRADLDPLARHYQAHPHDTGLHLLIGGAVDRGRGVGSALLRAVTDLVLNRRPACARVIAEPDLRNTPSVAAFLSAGFRFGAEIDLPAKRAALMIRDRFPRNLL